MKTNPMLLIDFYKAVHRDMLPKGIEYSVSYFTPRGTRVKYWQEYVFFGLQGFIKTYLIDYFNDNFFNLNKEDVIKSYERILKYTLGENSFSSKGILELHDLGYLPIKIDALAEGTLVPVTVPMFSIENTHKDFAWLPQALESLISAEMWHPIISATVGKSYRDIVNEYYCISCDDDIDRSKALGDFSFRGQECLQSAIKSSSGWLMSFANTATVPAIPYLEENYNCNCETEPVGFGAISTEHSVMCSNFAVDGDEITFIKRAITELYPDQSFSIVLDSYDYWNIIDNVLPQLATEIYMHKGYIGIRGDVGDAVDVVTKTVFKLWETFGGTTNSKGYKVLHPNLKVIYADGITLIKLEKIYEILIENGFACNNVFLGVGSFSFQCVEEREYGYDNILNTYTEEIKLSPFTRDTANFAIKATYCEVDGKPIPIFKNPKGYSFKRSQKGKVLVYYDEIDKKIKSVDGCFGKNVEDEEYSKNLLTNVFKDGIITKETSLKEIRNRVNKGEF